MFKIVVLGNCQAFPVAAMLREAHPNWDIQHWTVYLPETWQQIDYVRASLLDADVIITQPISDGFAGVDCLATSWIQLNKKPNTDLFILPVFYYRGQHAGMFNLRYNGTQIESLGTPYHDVLAVKALLDSGSIDIAHEIAVEGPSLKVIDKVADWSLSELERREQSDGVTIPFSGYLKERWRDTGLFHCFNHPTRPLLAHQLNGCLLTLGHYGKISESGYDHLQFPHFPVPPALEKLEWSMERSELFHVPAGVFTRSDFYRIYLEDIAKIEPRHLYQAIHENEEISHFLKIINA